MPQFNWAVFGPIVIVLALAGGGFFYFASHLPRAAGQSSQRSASAVASKTPTPPSVQVPGRVIGTPHVRSQPSSTSGVVLDLQSGQTVQVSACSDSCAYYLVGSGGQPQGWVSAAFIDLQGDEHKLPVAH